MLLYIGVALWPLIVQWIYLNKPFSLSKKPLSRNQHILFALLPIFVLIAFRSNTMGADTSTYMRHFLMVARTPMEKVLENNRMETGYLYFIYFLSRITKDPLVYQVVCVSVMFIGLYSFLKNLENDDPFLFLYFYCTLGLFFFMFTGTRQCMAMGICLFSYQFVRQKKYVKFTLCLILAFYFHKSAILFLAVPFIRNRNVNGLNIALYMVVVFIVGQYLDVIQDWFNEQLDYSYEIEETNSGLIFLLVLILLTVFNMILVYNRDGNLNQSKYTRALMNINFISVFLWIMRLQTRVAERPSYYFLFFSCAFYANALNSIKDNKQRFMYKMLVCACAMLLFVYRLGTNFRSLVPYAFFSR